MKAYKFRNLPCRCKATGQEMRWAVVGSYADGSGGGVLEWCYNQGDAEHLVTEMEKDSRFTCLRAVEMESIEYEA